MTDKTRVVLADDHPILLAGLRNLIEAEPNFELVGHAGNGKLAIQMIEEKVPDIAVVDISMPELSGIELAHQVRETCPTVRVLVLTLHEERSFVMQALAAGVRGYLLKRSASENLTQAIHLVSKGELYIDPLLTIELRHELTEKSDAAQQEHGRLTSREESVLKFSAQGLTIKEIAARLSLSGKTVETYKARAAEKLHLHTRAQIIRFAAAQGWLEKF